MRLQKSSLFGLYAVLELASAPNAQLSTSEIAVKYGISPHHLAKVMMTLVRAGLAQSVRGVGGGYRFTGNASRVTLSDVIELFEPIGSGHDFADNNAALETPVGLALQHVRDEIDELAKATLRSITIKTLLRNAEKLDETLGAISVAGD
jgi:Rrf2 family protein